MRLLVISHTPHYFRETKPVGWAPTVREIDHLATRFTTVRHVACLHDGPAPDSCIGYEARNLTLVPVSPAGADGVLGKLDVLLKSPSYVATIRRELRDADVVHVRAPANIAMIAMLVLALRKRPRARWFKYAGNWHPTGHESLSYKLQRWWLQRSAHKGIVTVNGRWGEQPSWIRSFHNPSLDESDLRRGKRAASVKRLERPIRLLFVGQLMASKGAGRTIEILARARSRGIQAVLDLVGDGDERVELERRAHELGVDEHVTFHGWQPPTAVHGYYEKAHFIVLPSGSEGWPKVLSEAMAFGAVPLASNVSAIPQNLALLRAGVTCDPHDVEGFVSAIASYDADPERWSRESATAVAGAELFSYRYYLESVDQLLHDLTGVEVSLRP